MHKSNKLLWFAFPYTLTFCKYIYKWKNKANKQKEMFFTWHCRISLDWSLSLHC